MNILKLQVITTLFVVLTAGQVFADAVVCDECMDEKVKGQTVVFNSSVSSDTIKVAKSMNGEIIDGKMNAELCAAVRSQVDSIENPRFSYTEWELFKLAGIRDTSNETPLTIRKKIQTFWKQHHEDLECKDTIGNFPRGNYLKQLMGGHIKDKFTKFIKTYRLDPNVIDKVDGCTALDYVQNQIRSTRTYSEATINRFKEYRDLLLKAGAKSANELGGRC